MDAPYRRLAAVLRQRIVDGTYPPGAPFPSHRRLADQHHVGIGTAYQAVALLRSEGLLTGRPRARLTVAYPPGVRTLIAPDAPWPYESGEPRHYRRRATPDLALRLAVPSGALLHVERVDQLDPDHRPAFLSTTWRRSIRPHPHASYECVADPLHRMTRDEADDLGLPAGMHAVRIERTRYDTAGRPVETTDLVLPADRWQVRL